MFLENARTLRQTAGDKRSERYATARLIVMLRDPHSVRIVYRMTHPRDVS